MNIFVQMMSKKGEMLNFKNWVLRGHFNQITLNLNDITLFYLSYLHFYCYKNFKINLVI